MELSRGDLISKIYGNSLASSGQLCEVWLIRLTSNVHSPDNKSISRVTSLNKLPIKGGGNDNKALVVMKTSFVRLQRMFF